MDRNYSLGGGGESSGSGGPWSVAPSLKRPLDRAESDTTGYGAPVLLSTPREGDIWRRRSIPDALDADNDDNNRGSVLSRSSPSSSPTFRTTRKSPAGTLPRPRARGKHPSPQPSPRRSSKPHNLLADLSDLSPEPQAHGASSPHAHAHSQPLPSISDLGVGRMAVSDQKRRFSSGQVPIPPHLIPISSGGEGAGVGGEGVGHLPLLADLRVRGRSPSPHRQAMQELAEQSRVALAENVKLHRISKITMSKLENTYKVLLERQKEPEAMRRHLSSLHSHSAILLRQLEELREEEQQLHDAIAAASN